MAKVTTLILLAIVSVVYFSSLTGSNSVFAQNTTNQTTTAANMTNMTNMTALDTSASSAKLHLGEAIKALEMGDNGAAMTHLNAAQQAVAGASVQAKMHFDEGMSAMSAGDSFGALMHFRAANQALS